ncbi:RNA polymerase subunit sigma-70 [Actinomadura hibisca]|uniref:RNA polymerase subunit sigma-70 n=1 Tax=Actinomadura hibisca TaxID=68565 RepID=UPI001FDEA39F|nr:RNA polymerase subunit sigma-70 [Actinomadura hibisca]
MTSTEDFAVRAEAHRRELRVHCYRLAGSFDEAEDLVQETLLRAWRSRDQLEDGASLRAWLYKIATNTCLDFLRRVDRRPRTYAPVAGMDHGDGTPPDFLEWLQPFPDALLDPERPDEEAVARETVELVFLIAIQHLTPQQRAVFVFREVLGWTAAETAAAMDLSVASVNSALQRAKPGLRRHLPEDRAQWSTQGPTAEERKVIDAYMAVSQSGNLDGIADLLTSDIVLTMPPNPFWFTSRAAMMAFVGQSLNPVVPMYLGEWKYLPAAVNRMPAVAGYVRRPGTTIFRAQTLEALRVRDGRIAEITTFEPHLLAAFGMPLVIR